MQFQFTCTCHHIIFCTNTFRQFRRNRLISSRLIRIRQTICVLANRNRQAFIFTIRQIGIKPIFLTYQSTLILRFTITRYRFCLNRFSCCIINNINIELIMHLNRFRFNWFRFNWFRFNRFHFNGFCLSHFTCHMNFYHCTLHGFITFHARVLIHLIIHKSKWPFSSF